MANARAHFDRVTVALAHGAGTFCTYPQVIGYQQNGNVQTAGAALPFRRRNGNMKNRQNIVYLIDRISSG